MPRSHRVYSSDFPFSLLTNRNILNEVYRTPPVTRASENKAVMDLARGGGAVTFGARFTGG